MKSACSLLVLGAIALAYVCFLPSAFAAPLPNAWQITDNSSAAGGWLYYHTDLTFAQRQAVTNGGFSYSVNARLVTDFAGPKTMGMGYGFGNRRFFIYFSLTSTGDLVAEIEGLAPYTVTTNGTGTALYHTHEIIYDPATGKASYRMDGQTIATNWSGSATAFPLGQVYWGASVATARGQMNFNLVSFEITNGVVAKYDPDDGLGANPVAQGWILDPVATLTNTGVLSIRPDTDLLPVATTLAADQLTRTNARLNGQVISRGSPTTTWFEWGVNTNYGNMTAAQSVGASLNVSNINTVLGGLMGGTEYHYRLVASNTFGAVLGTDQFFTPLSFTKITIPGLVGVGLSSLAWGDYDRDGRLDFLFTGFNGSTQVSQIWRNTGGGFSNVTAQVAPGLTGVDSGSVAWGDYDGDGWLDFLLTGNTGTTNLSQVWRNTGSGFTNATAQVAPGLTAVREGFAMWGDYDEDGRLDFLISGTSTTGFSSQLWRNTGSGFSNVSAQVAPGLPGLIYSAAAWGDYDGDGRLDFLITGFGNGFVSQIWRNTGNGFSNVTAQVIPDLTGVYSGAVAWGDYDGDGRLDFLLTGNTGATEISQLWRNTGSGFTNVTAQVAPGLPGVYLNSVAWGDYDGDGRLDFLISGNNSAGNISQLWRNTGSGFTNVTGQITPGLPALFGSSVAWGDYDGDGRLDFLIAGWPNGNSSEGICQLWQNIMPGTNAPPAAPTALSATLMGTTVSLNWNAPTDDLTPAVSLNYNVFIGTSPGASDVVAPMALTNGLRLLPALGNIQAGLSARYPLVSGRTYYWGVQALDTSFAGSFFAVGQPITIGPQLGHSIRYLDGTFEFYYTNLSVLNFDVLASTNAALPVSNWIDLGSALHLGGGYYRFTDPSAIGKAQRFYRLREQ